MNPPVSRISEMISLARDEQDLLGILKLQQANLPVNISAEEAIEQGFVTVEHSFDVLKRMNVVCPHMIASNGDVVIGYALVMTKEFRHDIPVLIPMFEMIDQLTIEGNRLSDQRYVVMGQICIAREFRGLGLFDSLYARMKKELAGAFRYCVTEVASRNRRSVRAHERIGFVTEHVYVDPRGEEWKIMIWKWKAAV